MISGHRAGQYDGGKRVKKVVPNGETTIFVYDASGKMLAEYSTVLNPTPQVSYLTNDHLGSPRINTDQNGAVISRHDYRPFGEEIATNQRTSGLGYGADDNRKQFTGYERDKETDMDFAQARYYEKNHGRFTTSDPLLASGKATTSQTWNRYAYVMNNPLRFIDPSGLCSAPAGLKPGQVGICLEAFIAAPTVGGIGKGDNRGFNGNNESFTARVMVTSIISTDEKQIYSTNNTKIQPSDVAVEAKLTENGRIDLPDGSTFSSTVGVSASLPSAANTSVSLSNVKVSEGVKDFGAGVDVTVSISDGKNGFQVHPLTSIAAPGGTIDGSVTLRITGSGNVTGVSANGRPFPSYAAYSYTVGADGKIQTKNTLSSLKHPPFRI